jgi:phosphomevalonate kinase
LSGRGGSLSAPGKLFLAGEYGVLDPGRPALVLAVDRSLHAEWSERGDGRVALLHAPSGARLAGRLEECSTGPVRWEGPVPAGLRFAARAVALGLRHCAEAQAGSGAPTAELCGLSLTFLDDLSLALGGAATPPDEKPGLGGSAAATVVALRATCAAQGQTLPPLEALPLAYAAHWIEQGGSGSGGDVAASALGGAQRVRVGHAWESADGLSGASAHAIIGARPLEAVPVALPDDLLVLAVYSGRSADTRALVGAVRRFARAEPARWGRLADGISGAALLLAEALDAAARDEQAAPRDAAREAIRRAAAAMTDLGAAASCPIVTPALSRICALAEAAGCAAKPSGAGGGDCAVVLCFGEAEVARAEALLAEAGFPFARVRPAPPSQPAPLG